MIVNVKTMMAIVMATVLMLAVVIPITGAMAELAAGKEYADNEVKASDYRMARGGSSADLTISNSGGSVKLYANGGEGVTMAPNDDFIVADTFILTVKTVEGAVQFNVYSFGDSDPYIGAVDGAYMTVHDGKWAIYNTGAPRSMKEVKEVKEPVKTSGGAKAVPTPDVQGVYRSVYYADDKGDWLFADAPVKVDSGVSFYVLNLTAPFVVFGTLDAMSMIYPPRDTSPAIECSYTEDGATNTLASMTVTFPDTDPEEVTSGFLVPLKYTAEEQTSMTGTLVSLIPVVLIVAIIIAAVSMLILRRQEDGF